jgi:hypothetical protein
MVPPKAQQEFVDKECLVLTPLNLMKTPDSKSVDALRINR